MREEAEGTEGRGLSEPPPPPPLFFSPPPSPSLALPPPRTLRRREGELPGVLRGELLAVLRTEEETESEVSSGTALEHFHISFLIFDLRCLYCHTSKNSSRRFYFDKMPNTGQTTQKTAVSTIE